MQDIRNVFEAINKYGHDEDFYPVRSADFSPTEAPAGSKSKIERMRERAEMGLPLWHEDDRSDYGGLTGAIRPRK